MDSNEDHNMAEESQHNGEYDEGDPNNDGKPSSTVHDEELSEKNLTNRMKLHLQIMSIVSILQSFQIIRKNVTICTFCM